MSFDNRILRHQVQIRRGGAAAESCELWVAPIMAMTRAEDNDTPDQSPSEREKRRRQ